MTKEMRIRIPKPDLNAKNQKQTKREPPLFRPPCAIQCSAERVLGEESVKLVDASRAGADSADVTSNAGDEVDRVLLDNGADDADAGSGDGGTAKERAAGRLDGELEVLGKSGGLFLPLADNEVIGHSQSGHGKDGGHDGEGVEHHFD